MVLTGCSMDPNVGAAPSANSAQVRTLLNPLYVHRGAQILHDAGEASSKINAAPYSPPLTASCNKTDGTGDAEVVKVDRALSAGESVVCNYAKKITVYYKGRKTTYDVFISTTAALAAANACHYNVYVSDSEIYSDETQESVCNE